MVRVKWLHWQVRDKGHERNKAKTMRRSRVMWCGIMSRVGIG